MSPPGAGDTARPVSSILVSSADKRIMVLDNGAVVADGPATIADPSAPLGNHVFILQYVDATNKQVHWRSIGYYNNAAAGG